MKNESLYKLRIWMFAILANIFLVAGLIEAWHEGLLWSQVCFVVTLLMAIYCVSSFLTYKLEKNFEEIKDLIEKKEN